MNDHYVSQTYLRGFTNQDGYLIPYYKSNFSIVGKPKRPKTVCHESDGDSNKYFDDPRVLDLYLPQFENSWATNVQILRKQDIDDIVKYQMAGYIAFLRACTPTAKRIGQKAVEAITRPVVEQVLEEFYRTNPPKEEKLRAEIGKLIEEKRLGITVDRQFPHALAISSLEQSISRYVRGNWLVIVNDTHVPFITSDNPAVPYYPSANQSKAKIFVPLAPDIGLLIDASDLDVPLTFPLERGVLSTDVKFGNPKPGLVETLNDLIIKTSEMNVFSERIDLELAAKVRDYKDWWLETVTEQLPFEHGMAILTRQLPRKKGV